VDCQAAVGLTGYRAGGVVRKGGIAPLAPGVEREPRQHRAGLISDGGNGAQVILVEIPRHAARLVEGGIGDREAVARGHVALEAVGECRVDRPAGYGGHPMRQRLTRCGIAVGPYIRLGRDVAYDVVGEALVERRGREIDGRGGEAVQLS